MRRSARANTVFRNTDLAWVRDTDRTIVIDEKAGQVHTLLGLDGMVWSWLTLGYGYSKLVSLLAEALAIPSGEAEKRLSSLLQEWTRLGLVIEEDAVHG